MEQFSNTEMLEPIELYKTRLKDAFHVNAEKYFDELDKKAKIDVNANQSACATYYKESDTVKKASKQRSGLKVGKVFSIIFSIILIVVGIALFAAGSSFGLSMTLSIILGIVAVLLGGGLIALAIVLSKRIKNVTSFIDEHQKKADQAFRIAVETIKPLNDLFEWNMAANLMSETTPLIQMDQVFDGKKYQMLHERFNFDEDNSTDTSSVFVQSGAILGNPFVFQKNYCQTMRTHRYVGTRTISYKVKTDDGYRTVTEVLSAHVDAPEPAYYYDTVLVYGNDAAPDLSFYREPTKVNTMNEKEIERFVRKTDKELDAMVQKSLKKGGNFTRLANEEFEALFHAFDRDNETQFRLLFTPLAQKNMINLIKDNSVGFGDDFTFRKSKKLNYVFSGHMQGSDSLDKDPDSLKCFDYKLAKEVFVNYADKYLKDIFFNFAPLISIPLYQQHKTIEYIYHDTFKHNVTKAETESAANSYDPRKFAHKDTRSEGVILKSNFDHTDGKCDVCTISAHSFRGDDKVSMIPVRAGNGGVYDVAVNWIEYSPIHKETPFVITDTETNIEGYREQQEKGKFNDIVNKFGSTNDSIYKKRLFSFILKDNK